MSTDGSRVGGLYNTGRVLGYDDDGGDDGCDPVLPLPSDSYEHMGLLFIVVTTIPNDTVTQYPSHTRGCRRTDTTKVTLTGTGVVTVRKSRRR